jgi:hypothetical protein
MKRSAIIGEKVKKAKQFKNHNKNDSSMIFNMPL